MSTLRTAAQQALDALEEYQSNGAPFLACDGAVDALRAALAQQDESEMYAAAYSSACKEFRKIRDQRDALLEALKSTGLFLHHCWCDVQMNDHSFEKLNRQMEIVDAAIKAVEGEKA